MNLLLNGLLDGLNISLVAFAFGVVWAAIKTVNVVQAEVIPACGVALWVCRNDGMLTQYVVAILIAIALAVASFVIVRLVLRRAPDPRLMTLIVSIALTGMIGAVLQVITSSQTVSPPKVLPSGMARWRMPSITCTSRGRVIESSPPLNNRDDSMMASISGTPTWAPFFAWALGRSWKLEWPPGCTE